MIVLVDKIAKVKKLYSNITDLSKFNPELPYQSIAKKLRDARETGKNIIFSDVYDIYEIDEFKLKDESLKLEKPNNVKFRVK